MARGTDALARSRAARRASCAAALLSLCACGDSGSFTGPGTTPDYAQFEKSAYPVLLRDCAFSAECHGSSERFFQVYGPGRTRLDPKSKPDDPATPDEIARSYNRAVSMLMTGKTFRDSLLLRKPLETSQGGQGHKGVDVFGRNVFATRNDPNYLALASWAASMGAGPGAAPGAKP